MFQCCDVSSGRKETEPDNLDAALGLDEEDLVDEDDTNGVEEEPETAEDKEIEQILAAQLKQSEDGVKRTLAQVEGFMKDSRFEAYEKLLELKHNPEV